MRSKMLTFGGEGAKCKIPIQPFIFSFMDLTSFNLEELQGIKILGFGYKNKNKILSKVPWKRQKKKSMLLFHLQSKR